MGQKSDRIRDGQMTADLIHHRRRQHRSDLQKQQKQPIIIVTSFFFLFGICADEQTLPP